MAISAGDKGIVLLRICCVELLLVNPHFLSEHPSINQMVLWLGGQSRKILQRIYFEWLWIHAYQFEIFVCSIFCFF